MNKPYTSKQVLLLSLALFSMFFGAGNLILPPFLGYKQPDEWLWLGMGFMISAVLVPLLGILAHANSQGTLRDLAKGMPSYFSLCYAFIIYTVSVSLPAPRTASVTYEMAILPWSIDISALLFSTLYFVLVFLLVLFRSKILDLLGKYHSPVLLIFLFLLIGLVLGKDATPNLQRPNFNSLTSGLLEGYQTFDAIGAVVIGGVMIISLKLSGIASKKVMKGLITRAAFFSGLGLLIIYFGLMASGAALAPSSQNLTRSGLLSFLGSYTLGNVGQAVLSILIALACFTTALGIVTGASDFGQSLFGGSRRAFKIAAALSCLLGIIMGQLPVAYIIGLAVPVLQLVYPITITLIILNLIPKQRFGANRFQILLWGALIFSLPDFLYSLPIMALKKSLIVLPFVELGIGWLVPTVLLGFLLFRWNSKNEKISIYN